MPDAAPDAWQAGEASLLALFVALAAQEGRPVPSTVLRRAVEDAIASRWLETTPGSGAWPCNVGAAGAVSLRPARRGRSDLRHPVTPTDSTSPAGYGSSAELDPGALHDLVDAQPDIVNAAAGLPLEFRLDVKSGPV